MKINIERHAEMTIEKFDELRSEGKTEKEICEYFNLATPMYRLIKARMLFTRLDVQTSIAKRMLEKGMTRSEIAECIGVSESTIRSWDKHKLMQDA